MLKYDRTIKHYSESFKLKVLSELTEGRHSKNEISRIYGIGGSSITRWIKKYGKLDLLNQRVKIETMEDIDNVKKLEEEIKQLKELLVQKDIKGYMDDAYLEWASEQLGFKNVEELKKKLKPKQSPKQ
jgi:transposase-like protein